MNLLMPMTYDFACAYSLVASAIFHGFNCVRHGSLAVSAARPVLRSSFSSYLARNITIIFESSISVESVSAFWAPLRTLSCLPHDLHRSCCEPSLSFRPIVYYIFFCSPISLAIWLTIVGILFPLFFWMPFATFFHDKRILRTLLFVFGSLIPFFSWSQYLIMYGYNDVMHELLFSKVMISYLCYGFGIVLYVVRAPERFAPGYFDNLGTSHQIWHALVCLGMFNLHYSVYTTRDFRLANDFECLIFP